MPESIMEDLGSATLVEQPVRLPVRVAQLRHDVALNRVLSPKLADLVLERLELVPLGGICHLPDRRPNLVEAHALEALGHATRTEIAAAGPVPPRRAPGFIHKPLRAGDAPAPELAQDERFVALLGGVTVGAPQPRRPPGELLDPLSPSTSVVGRCEVHVEVGEVAADVEVRPGRCFAGG